MHQYSTFSICKILVYEQGLCMEFSKMEIQYEHWRTLSTVLIICRMFFFLCSIRKADHGYTTTTETLICPGWETLVVPVSQRRTPGRDKRGVLLSRVWQPGPFFSCFSFLNSFSISIILLHFN